MKSLNRYIIILFSVINFDINFIFPFLCFFYYLRFINSNSFVFQTTKDSWKQSCCTGGCSRNKQDAVAPSVRNDNSLLKFLALVSSFCLICPLKLYLFYFKRYLFLKLFLFVSRRIN